MACDDENGDGACEPTVDTYHIIEAKFRSTSGSVSNSSVWFGRPKGKPAQMTDPWIEQTVRDMVQSDDDAIASLGEDLLLADESNIENEVMVVQNDEQNGKTVLENLREDAMDISHVHIVKLSEVVG